MNQLIDVNLFYGAFICYGFSMVTYFLSFWKRTGKLALAGNIVLLLGLVMQIIGLFTRGMAAHFMPITNIYESLNFFSAVIVISFLFVEWKFQNRVFGVFILPIVFLLMAFSSLPSTSKEIVPLIPALQSQWLVWHVVLSFIGEAAFAVSFGAGLMYLILESSKKGSFPSRTFPDLETLDALIYRAIAVGFPIFTLGALIFGAVWAKYAWGNYWSWDPKETWALITWIVYALFLHVRIVRGWRGRATALLGVIGFLFTLFTLFGVNYLLSGLHSYAN
jgi:cytochrome c-type biogenesis protein CcsB